MCVRGANFDVFPSLPDLKLYVSAKSVIRSNTWDATLSFLIGLIPRLPEPRNEVFLWAISTICSRIQGTHAVKSPQKSGIQIEKQLPSLLSLFISSTWNENWMEASCLWGWLALRPASCDNLTDYFPARQQDSKKGTENISHASQRGFVPPGPVQTNWCKCIYYPSEAKYFFLTRCDSIKFLCYLFWEKFTCFQFPYIFSHTVKKKKVISVDVQGSGEGRLPVSFF